MALNLGSIFFGLRADTSGLRGAGGDIDRFGRDAAASLARAQKALADVAEAARKAKKDQSDAAQMLRALSEASALTLGPLDGLTYRMRAASLVMREFGSATGVALGTFAGFTVGMVTLGREIISNTIAIQQAHMTLQGITNSAAVAGAEIEYLRDVAKQSGFAFTDLSENFARFVASATGAGQSLSVTNMEFKQLALLTGTLHLSSQEMNNVIMAFDHMLSMGRVQFQQLRQLFYNMPAVFTVAAQAAKDMGIDLEDASRKGQVAASDFIQHFLADADQMFHIDLAKPIDSLQASLGRLKGSWQTFVTDFSTAIGAGDSFKNLFTGLSNTLDMFSRNVNTVVKVLGALVGALAGVAAMLGVVLIVQAVVAVWNAFTLAVTVSTVQIGVWLTQMGVAIYTTEELAAAQGMLNVVMGANPFWRAVQLLGMLAAALIGAKLGMDAFNQVQVAVQTSMADTTSIDTYIQRQIELGKQVSSVTEEMKKQVAVMQAQNSAQYAQALSDLGNAKRWQGIAQSFTGNPTNVLDTMRAGALMVHFHTLSSAAARSQADLEALQAQARVDDLAKANASLQSTMSGLNKVGTLPEDQTLGKSNPRETKTSVRSLRALDDIIVKAQQAEMALENMWRGPLDSGVMSAYEDAQKRLFGLKPAEVAEVGKLLGVSANSANDLLAPLTQVAIKANLATTTVREFGKVWQDIQTQNTKSQGFRDIIDFLGKGGNPYDLSGVKGLEQANQELTKLRAAGANLTELKNTLEALQNPKGGKLFNDQQISEILDFADKTGSTALEALSKALNQVGIQGHDATQQLAQLYGQTDRLSESAQKLTSLSQQLVESWRNMSMGSRQLGATSLAQFGAIGASSQATSMLQGLDTSGLAAYNNQLQALGYNFGSVHENLTAFLIDQANIKEQVDIVSQGLQNQKQAWLDFGDQAVDTFQQMLTGATSMSDGLKSILNQLGTTILNASVFNPIKTYITSAITSIFQRGAGGSGAGGLTAAFADLIPKLAIETTARTAEIAALGTSTASLTALSASAIAATAGLATAAAAAFAMSAVQAAGGVTSAIGIAGAFLAQGGLVRHFGFGGLNGMISGPGGPTGDQIPAMLSDGEFVVNAFAARRWLPLLKMLNAGLTPHFAAGGSVDDMFGPTGTVASSSGSRLIGPRGSTIIVEGDTNHFYGVTPDEMVDQMRQIADAKVKNLENQVPYMIDSRVNESQLRGRISRVR